MPYLYFPAQASSLNQLPEDPHKKETRMLCGATSPSDGGHLLFSGAKEALRPLKASFDDRYSSCTILLGPKSLLKVSTVRVSLDRRQRSGRLLKTIRDLVKVEA